MNQKWKKVAIGAAIALGGFGTVGVAYADIISNGTILMGVNSLGHLNAPYSPPGGDPLGINNAGLRYVPTGAASTEPGCLCEGWGIALKSANISGYANQASGTANLSLVSFSSTASTATSVVRVDNGTGPVLQVTHDYAPSAATPNLYRVNVTVQNLTGAAIAAGDIVYRRVMDWDIYPTPFNEYVTIQGVPSTLGYVASGGTTNVLRTDNNGFNSSDPFTFSAGTGSTFGLTNVNFTDAGPDDHGALFDFDFAGVAAGGSFSFTTYYGATATESAADAARALVGMNLYSYGQSTQDGGNHGTPNTFIFGFGTTAGGVLTPVPEPETYAMMMAGLGLLAFMQRRRNRKTA